MKSSRSTHADLTQELIDFAWDEAPKHIPGLYLGLDYESVEEVITDTLARISRGITLPSIPEAPSALNCEAVQKVAKEYQSYVSYLLHALPIFVKKTRNKVVKEIRYEMRHVSYGLTPPEDISGIDRSDEHYTNN